MEKSVYSKENSRASGRGRAAGRDAPVWEE